MKTGAFRMAQKGNGRKGRRGMWENIYQTSSSLLRFQVIYWLLPAPPRHYLPFFFLLHSTFNSSCLASSHLSIHLPVLLSLPPLFSLLFLNFDLGFQRIRSKTRLYKKYIYIKRKQFVLSMYGAFLKEYFVVISANHFNHAEKNKSTNRSPNQNVFPP